MDDKAFPTGNIRAVNFKDGERYVGHAIEVEYRSEKNETFWMEIPVIEREVSIGKRHNQTF
jgi:hypothetical protein